MGYFSSRWLHLTQDVTEMATKKHFDGHAHGLPFWSPPLFFCEGRLEQHWSWSFSSRVCLWCLHNLIPKNWYRTIWEDHRGSPATCSQASVNATVRMVKGQGLGASPTLPVPFLGRVQAQEAAYSWGTVSFPPITCYRTLETAMPTGRAAVTLAGLVLTSNHGSPVSKHWWIGFYLIYL